MTHFGTEFGKHCCSARTQVRAKFNSHLGFFIKLKPKFVILIERCSDCSEFI